MKMKFGILVVCIMLVISTTFAYAEDETDGDVNIDEHTREEIEIFDDTDGAVIRLLQLEKAVTNNIFKGEIIVTNLSESGFETLEFEAILAEMSLLLGEIQSVDVNSSEAIYLFVELKQDAIDLSKEFRDSLHELIDNATKEALQETIQNLVCEKAQGLQNTILNKIALFNGKQLVKIFGILGKSNSPIVQDYQNRNISLQQVKQQLALMVHNLTEDEKFDVIIQLEPNRIRLQIQSRVSIQNITNQYGYRKCNRLRNRLNNSETIEDEGVRLFLQQRMRLRINQTEDGHSGGNGNGQGYGGGNGSGSGSGQGSGDNNETFNGNGYKNGPGGGGQ